MSVTCLGQDFGPSPGVMGDCNPTPTPFSPLLTNAEPLSHAYSCPLRDTLTFCQKHNARRFLPTDESGGFRAAGSGEFGQTISVCAQGRVGALCSYERGRPVISLPGVGCLRYWLGGGREGAGLCAPTRASFIHSMCLICIAIPCSRSHTLPVSCCAL